MTEKKKYIERVKAGQALKGTVLHKDKTRDLALVRLDKVPPDVPALPLARNSSKVGESIIKILNPSKVNAVFATVDGQVRGVAVVDHVVDSGDGSLRIKTKMVQTVHPLGADDSGGPVIDRRGYLVAVEISGHSGVQNVNNAIDVTEVHALLKEKKIALRLPPEPVTPRRIPPPPERTDEQVAADMLKRARLFADDADTRPLYVTRLKRLVEKYPDTPAGKEARKLLDNMK
jgi:S1-C subfamily serine protease